MYRETYSKITKQHKDYMVIDRGNRLMEFQVGAYINPFPFPLKLRKVVLEDVCLTVCVCTERSQ